MKNCLKFLVNRPKFKDMEYFSKYILYAEMLGKMNRRILVVGSTKIVINNFFNSFRQYLKEEGLYDSLIRDIRHPYQLITLITGSQMRGFKCNPCSLCGEDADVIIVLDPEKIDEDVMIGAILPILHTTDGSKLYYYDSGISQT